MRLLDVLHQGLHSLAELHLEPGVYRAQPPLHVGRHAIIQCRRRGLLAGLILAPAHGRCSAGVSGSRRAVPARLLPWQPQQAARRRRQQARGKGGGGGDGRAVPGGRGLVGGVPPAVPLLHGAACDVQAAVAVRRDVPQVAHGRDVGLQGAIEGISQPL